MTRASPPGLAGGSQGGWRAPAWRTAELGRAAVHWPEIFVSDVLGAAARAGTDLPRVLVYYPVAHLNPFQHLLYAQAEQAGYALVPAARVDEIGTVGWGGRAVVHLHWLAGLLRSARHGAQAMETVADLDARMLAWRRQGYRIVWTVHNILPHRTVHLEAEVALRKAVVRRAHLVHVMSRNTAQAVRPWYALPQRKLLHVPHPSYAAWYPAFRGRQACRADLDMGPDEFAFLFFGSLQPYKGVLELLSAYDALRAAQPGRKLRLVIAGKPVDPAYCEEIAQRVRGRRDVSFWPSTIEDAQLQTLFTAADVVVVPYLRTLNSGVALLAATFRRMVVGPDAGALAQTFAEDPALLYDEADPDGLRGAMARALSHRADESVLGRIAGQHDPAALSARFFQGLDERLFRAARPAGGAA